MTIQTLKKNLIFLKDSNNLSIEDFSKIIGYTIIDTERLLYGELLIRPKKIKEIGEKFGVSLEWFFEKKHEGNVKESDE